MPGGYVFGSPLVRGVRNISHSFLLVLVRPVPTVQSRSNRLSNRQSLGDGEFLPDFVLVVFGNQRIAGSRRVAARAISIKFEIKESADARGSAPPLLLKIPTEASADIS